MSRRQKTPRCIIENMTHFNSDDIIATLNSASLSARFIAVNYWKPKVKAWRVNRHRDALRISAPHKSTWPRFVENVVDAVASANDDYVPDHIKGALASAIATATWNGKDRVSCANLRFDNVPASSKPVFDTYCAVKVSEHARSEMQALQYTLRSMGVRFNTHAAKERRRKVFGADFIADILRDAGRLESLVDEIDAMRDRWLKHEDAHKKFIADARK